jgi:hypothetical protein
MRGKRRSRRLGSNPLEDALRALAAGLGDTGVGWAVIGGIAVIAHGVQRMTTDVDAVMVGGEIAISQLIGVLGARGIEPRMDDAESFAQANLVLLLVHRATGVEIDLSLGWTEFERSSIASSTPTIFGRTSLPMARPADLVAFKAIAARPKDVEDAVALLVMHPEIDLVATRRHVAELAAMAEAPELVEGLESMIALARRAVR